MARDNRGFTLLELVVVITIMGILMSLATISAFPSYSARARRCASQTDMLITKCRIGCLSRAENVYLTLHTDSDGKIIGDYYENDGVLVSADVLSEGRALMTYTVKSSGGTAETRNLGDSPLTLSFSRSTGAFKALPGGNYCTAINVLCGGRTYTIALTPSTGAHELS